MRRLLAVFLGLILATSGAIQASADLVNIEASKVDRDSGYLPTDFDIDYLFVADDTRYPEDIAFFLSMSGWLKADSYSSPSRFAQLLIDSNNDGETDFFFKTPNSVYPINRNALNVELIDARTGNPVSGCQGFTWMNKTGSANSSNYIGFQVNRSCLQFSETAAIEGYTYHSNLYSDETEPFEFKTGVTFEESSPGAPSVVDVTEQKLNAGSFKGYVALYAKGYKGHKFSAKVGKDWVVRPALMEDFVRIVEYTGPGYTIDVRMYIDGQLTETVTVTTK